MKKKRPNIDPNKIRGIETYSYKRIKELYNTEIEQIIKMLPDKESDESFKRSLRKYLDTSWNEKSQKTTEKQITYLQHWLLKY